jgi:hypothetical protein
MMVPTGLTYWIGAANVPHSGNYAAYCISVMGEAEGYCMSCGLQNRSIPVISLMEAAVSYP